MACNDRKQWHDETVTAALKADARGDLEALRNLVKKFNKRHRKKKRFTRPAQDQKGRPLDTLEKQAEYMGTFMQQEMEPPPGEKERPDTKRSRPVPMMSRPTKRYWSPTKPSKGIEPARESLSKPTTSPQPSA